MSHRIISNQEDFKPPLKDTIIIPKQLDKFLKKTLLLAKVVKTKLDYLFDRSMNHFFDIFAFFV